VVKIIVQKIASGLLLQKIQTRAGRAVGKPQKKRPLACELCEHGENMQMLKFELPIVPTAQARPRVAVRGKFAQAYKTTGQKDNERTLEACLKDHAPVKPMEGPIKLSIIAVMPIPKSASRKKQAAMLSGKEKPVKKPDSTNIAKQIEDACTRLQFWHDDSQITTLYAEKRYGENGRWEVEITELH